MTNQSISQWIQESFTDDLSQIATLTIRADGMIRNGAGIYQSPWSQNATGAIHLLAAALDRTVSHLRRGANKDLRFVPFLGGDQANGVAGHFHALLQYPSSADKQEFIAQFDRLWSVKVSDALKTTLRTSVFAEPLRNKEALAHYCMRFEGTTFGSGSDKVVMSRSLKL
jgi:hypothetical protein